MGTACTSVSRTAEGQEYIVLGYAYENPIVDTELCQVTFGTNSFYTTTSCIGTTRGYCSEDVKMGLSVPLYQYFVNGSPGYNVQDVDEEVMTAIDSGIEPLCNIINVADNYRCSTIDAEVNPLFYLSFGGLLSTQFVFILYPVIMLTWIVMIVYMIKGCIKTLCRNHKKYQMVPKIDVFETTDCETEIEKF